MPGCHPERTGHSDEGYADAADAPDAADRASAAKAPPGQLRVRGRESRERGRIQPIRTRAPPRNEPGRTFRELHTGQLRTPEADRGRSNIIVPARCAGSATGYGADPKHSMHQEHPHSLRQSGILGVRKCESAAHATRVPAPRCACAPLLVMTGGGCAPGDDRFGFRLRSEEIWSHHGAVSGLSVSSAASAAPCSRATIKLGPGARAERKTCPGAGLISLDPRASFSAPTTELAKRR